MFSPSSSYNATTTVGRKRRNCEADPSVRQYSTIVDPTNSAVIPAQAGIHTAVHTSTAHGFRLKATGMTGRNTGMTGGMTRITGWGKTGMMMCAKVAKVVGRKRRNCEADPSVRQYSTKVKPTLSQNRLQSGFTLIELLVVILLLAILAGTAVISYNGVQDQGRADTTKFEMAEIKKALLQFRRDSGSKSFPSQGIYDCDSTDLTDIAKNNDPNPPSLDTWPTGAPSADDDVALWSAWCKHPANFWMLFINPLDDLTTSPNEEGGWNQDTHRGWNGPYLQRNGGYLDIGNDLSTAGTGNPYTGDYVDNIWAIASPFIAEPDNGYLLWTNLDSSTTNGYQEYEQHGTPYFMFDLDDDDENNSDSETRLVSMGMDNEYKDTDKNGNAIEIDQPNCKQQLDNEDNPIDYVLCLLR